MKTNNHYNWLEENLETIFSNLNLNYLHYKGIIVAHGDKAYSYRNIWEKVGIPFYHGVAIYLLSHVSPYSSECRKTLDGWVPVEQWVIKNYERFKQFLPSI